MSLMDTEARVEARVDAVDAVDAADAADAVDAVDAVDALVGGGLLCQLASGAKLLSATLGTGAPNPAVTTPGAGAHSTSTNGSEGLHPGGSISRATLDG